MSGILVLDEMRERFREAAAREMARAPRARPRRRWWRFGGLALVGAGLVTAGVAGAGQLLSKGEPLEGAGVLAPGAVLGRGELALFAQDPTGGPPWAVATYETRDGDLCVEGGQVRGKELGLIEDGRFRPWGEGAVANCMYPESRGTVDTMSSLDGPPRTLIYGRARADVSRVVVVVDGRARASRPRHGGAFMFLFEGDVRASNIDWQVDEAS